MNVLIISHTYIAPINRDKWKTLAALYSDAHLTVVIPVRWPTHLFTHQAGDVGHDAISNCRFVALKVFNAGNEIRYGYDIDDLAVVMIQCKPDVIQVEQGDNALSYFQTIMLNKILGIKAKICFFTWVNWKVNKSWRYRCGWDWLERFNLYMSDGAVTGNHDAQAILRDKGFESPMIALPQIGLNPELFAGDAVRSDGGPLGPSGGVRMSDQKKHIGFFGRITHEKGVMLLLQAFANLHEKFPDWSLMFVGKGPALQELKEFVMQYVVPAKAGIQSYNLLSAVIFKEPVSHHEIAALLHSIDILALPSYDTPMWREQFGHVLIEAMAASRAIVASDAGEIPYVVGDAGLIFKQRDQAALHDCLARLMADDVLRTELGERGYQRMQRLYTHDIIAQKTYAFWQSL